ncbi:putative adenosine monophosphate-protein transferase Fic [Photobacterium aphoticum]|uniref:protein adenylyltransferase n=1 Tax=Photobacterium aphoticum TaxID=754436 RepID=A0A0J1GQE2_9GAMM|nr:putative adenosine monophosphate-protein transferase Fic [Photobacterium aphoticum]KLV02008.1 cell filamentation protein Fic [Photobacterium aphoticum]PSU60253.1 putative adenosine monophosphate-protein transferase Fic [Photobacterium aphoticum]GHA34383.1 putative adenosine monophosphate-protein transferase fic [Photobacterium aphoticum]
MHDKYDVHQDPDCYPDSDVLINLLSIKDNVLLEAAERDFTRVRAEHFMPQFDQFTLTYLQQIHHTLFQDLYAWAGKLRHVDITKGETRFCHWVNIEKEGNKLLAALADEHHLQGLPLERFIERIAHYYCELNVIHPFREGNGRVQRIFFEILAINAGYEICWEGIQLQEWVAANQAGYFGDLAPLHALFERITVPIDIEKGYDDHWNDAPQESP